MAEQKTDLTAHQNDQDGPNNPTIKRVTTDQGNKAQRLLRVDQM
jgi:hypothetical protein